MTSLRNPPTDALDGPTRARASAALVVELPPSVVDEIVARVAAEVLGALQAASSSPYLSLPEAADYMRCSRQRLYDLLSARRLTKYKDGARVLLSRAEIDAYLAGGVASALPPSRRAA
jgi:excisionase family DNA binding protein